MNYEYIRVTDVKPVYDYWCRVKDDVPYWFDTGYDLWKESFLADTDYDGDEMFDELVTYIAGKDGQTVGFIQFGVSQYIYDENGKNFDLCGGVIRHLHFDKEHDCGQSLISLAEEYFDERGIDRRFAFFHAFGMTCNAGHGKLFCALSHIEQAVFDAGFEKEHENVYYKRLLQDEEAASDEITVKYGEVNPKGLCEFSIHADDRYVGAGALVYLPQGRICYLKWIYIEGSEQGKGYASKALRHIFADLYAQGIQRIDTDTADGNFIAQRLYIRTDFEDMGRTRSYLK